MSDWQHCVDWFLAKYCRCKLRLDWCWCRWRTSAKGRCQWGLQVWRRKVALVRGTRWQEWQVEVVDGSMVESQSQDRAGTSWEPSHEWGLAEATPSSRGFQWFTWKPLDSLVDPQSQDRRPVATTSNQSDWYSRWVPVLPVEDTGLTGVRWRSSKSSKWRTHVVVTWCASKLHIVRTLGICLMVRRRRFPKCPSGACILVLVFKGSFVFRLPPYNPKWWEDGSYLLEP
jgi:hypothetical protein